MEARISRNSQPLSLPPHPLCSENNNEPPMNLNMHSHTRPPHLDNTMSTSTPSRMSDAYLSSTAKDSLKASATVAATSAPNTPEALRKGSRDKKEKMEFNQMMLRSLRPLSYHGSICLDHPHSHPAPPTVNKRHIASSKGRKESLLMNRRSLPYSSQRDKIDLSELDTNLPRIDMQVIETHLRQAREEERKRRTEREEIRRRLALEAEASGDDKPSRKNLHARLQSSMNLQICFMNETASDSESPSSDTESQRSTSQHVQGTERVRAALQSQSHPQAQDFVAKQAQLQAGARQALAQAKEVARLQITRERAGRAHSPITEMVRNCLQKVGVVMPPDRRRVSRQLLTEMNVAQLQVIVNDLHSHIEKLNERLVEMLLERDELHMEQDSVLVDIEDLTRYLAAKKSPHHSMPLAPSSK